MIKTNFILAISLTLSSRPIFSMPPNSRMSELTCNNSLECKDKYCNTQNNNYIYKKYKTIKMPNWMPD